MNLADPTEALVSAKEHMEFARSNFNKYGFLVPVSFIFMQRNPETGVKLPIPMIAVVIPAEGISDPEERKHYSASVRDLVVKGHALGVLGVYESWTVEGGLTLEEAQKWSGRLNEHPNRSEVLQALYYHVASGFQMWRSVISRVEGQAPVAGPFGPYKQDFSGLANPEGIFGDIFNPASYAATARS
jgi:hypothetical protein